MLSPKSISKKPARGKNSQSVVKHSSQRCLLIPIRITKPAYKRDVPNTIIKDKTGKYGYMCLFFACLNALGSEAKRKAFIGNSSEDDPTEMFRGLFCTKNRSKNGYNSQDFSDYLEALQKEKFIDGFTFIKAKRLKFSSFFNHTLSSERCSQNYIFFTRSPPSNVKATVKQLLSTKIKKSVPPFSPFTALQKIGNCHRMAGFTHALSCSYTETEPLLFDNGKKTAKIFTFENWIESSVDYDPIMYHFDITLPSIDP